MKFTKTTAFAAGVALVVVALAALAFGGRVAIKADGVTVEGRAR